MDVYKIVSSLPRGPENDAHYFVDTQSLMTDLGLVFNFEFSKISELPGVEVYFVEKWWCTDTDVGTAVIFCEGASVAVVQQSARKSAQSFTYIGAGRETLRSLVFNYTNRAKPAFEVVANPEIELFNQGRSFLAVTGE